MTNKCHAIILAGGTGRRMNSEIPKQFIKIKGLPIILHTIAKFLRISCIDTLVVVSPQDPSHHSAIKQLLNPLLSVTRKTIIVAVGGPTRHKSIFSGLQILHEKHNHGKVWCGDVVVIHDGVRPFVATNEIIDVIEAAKSYTASGLMKQIMGSSMKINDKHQLVQTLDRKCHVMGEAPQAFRLSYIFDCYEESSEKDLDSTTDCMQLLPSGDIFPKLVAGDSFNIKITTNADVQAARSLMLGDESILYTSSSFDASFISTSLGIRMYSEDDNCFANVLVSVVLFVVDIAEDNSLNCHLKHILESTPRFPYLSTIIILIACNGDEEKYSSRFKRRQHDICTYGISSHLVMVKDMPSSLGRLKNSLPLLADEALPSGQVLRF